MGFYVMNGILVAQCAERLVDYFLSSIEDYGNEIVFHLNLPREFNGAMWGRFGQYCQNATLTFRDRGWIYITFGPNMSFVAVGPDDSIMNTLRNSIEPNSNHINVIISPLHEARVFNSDEERHMVRNDFIKLEFVIRDNDSKIPLNLVFYRNSPIYTESHDHVNDSEGETSGSGE